MNLESTNKKLIRLYQIIDFTGPTLLFYLLNLLFTDRNNHLIYLFLGVLISTVFILVIQLTNGYHGVKVFHFSEKMKTVTFSWIITISIFIFFSFLFRKEDILSRRTIIVWLVFTPVLLITIRLIIKYLYFKKYTSTFKILLIGNTYLFNKNELSYLKKSGIEIKTIFSKKDLIKNIENELADFSPHYLINNLNKPIDESTVQYFIQVELKGYKFITLNHFMEIFLRKCFIPYQNYNLDYISEIRPYHFQSYCFKRVIDLLGSFLILISISVFLPYILYRIRKEDSGPSIYRQKRIGLKGKKFTIYKLRTMYLHSEGKESKYSKKNDPRILPIGKFLRKIRMDETIQCWNILRGDLHLIGPRTEWDILVANYEKAIPYYQKRHIVRPGISGWAQVMYPYGSNTEDARQKLMYDFYYLKYWSIWLEIETILKTIKIVFQFKGI